MCTSQQQIKPKLFKRASIKQRYIAAVIFVIVFSFFGFFAISGHYSVDIGRWLGHCSFQQRTGLPCPTCGMTRSTLAFAQGKILRAFYIQPACALICVMLVVIAIIAIIIAVLGIYFRFIDDIFYEIKLRHIIIALLIITVFGWAVTLARAAAGR